MLGSDEIWHVQLRDGEVRPVSLDELDAAFQSGIIDANAQVFAPGATTWTTLGAIAGLDDADEAPAAAAPAASADPIRAVQTAAAAPLSLSSFVAAEPSLPPSLAPMAFDLSASRAGVEFDLATQLEGDDLAFKPKRGRTIGIVAGACAAVAAVALAFGLRGAAADADMSAATNAVAAPMEVAAAAPPPVAPPAAAPPVVAPAAAEPGPSELTASAPRLSDEQRRLLLEADKAHADDIARAEARAGTRVAEKAKPKAKASAASKKASPKKKRGTASKKAGISGALDKYDPLNGAL